MHPLLAKDATAATQSTRVGLGHHCPGTWSGTLFGAFGCDATGDGKGMASMNHAPRKRCWCCDDASSLQPANAVAPTPRWGAFLRGVPPHRGVGADAHALVCICNAVRKRFGATVSMWVANAEGLGSVGCLKELWLEFTQDVARIPLSERTAMRPTKASHFDITLSHCFFTQPLW